MTKRKTETQRQKKTGTKKDTKERRERIKLSFYFSCFSSIYFYSFTIEHTRSSQTDAKGVHVTWMMAPFLQFKTITSVLPSQFGSSPQVVFKDDGWVFKVRQENSNRCHCCSGLVKEALSVLMLSAPVFIFTSGSSALLGCPRCGLSI